MACMSTEETFKFIELYQAENCLWNPRNKHYKNKNVVNDSWKRIADTMGVPASELKKKKDNLLATFRVNLKKKKSSMKSGAGVEDVYKPIWIYYDVLAAFLTDVYDSTNILNTEEQTQPDWNDEASASDEQAGTILPEIKNNDDVVPPPSNPQKNPLKRRAMDLPELQEASKQMSVAFTALNNALKNKGTEKKDDDDCELFCRMLAKQIRDFPKIEREEIMYEIHGIVINRRRRYRRMMQSQSRSYDSPLEVIISQPATSNSIYLSSTPSPEDYAVNSPQPSEGIN